MAILARCCGNLTLGPGCHVLCGIAHPYTHPAATYCDSGETPYRPYRDDLASPGCNAAGTTAGASGHAHDGGPKPYG